MSEKQKLLELLKSVDKKQVDYIEFTPAEYARLVGELRPLGAKVKVSIIPPKKRKK